MFDLVSVGMKNVKVFSLNPPKLEKNEAMLIQGAVGVQLNPKVKQLKEKLEKVFPIRYSRHRMINETCMYRAIWPVDGQ